MRSFSKGVVYGRFRPRKALAGEFFSVWLVGRLSLINMGGGRLGEVVAHGALSTERQN